MEYSKVGLKTKMASGVSEFIVRCRRSRRLVLAVVCFALFVDYVLLTTVVPIIPKFLLSLEHQVEISNLTHEQKTSTVCYNMSETVGDAVDQESTALEKLAHVHLNVVITSVNKSSVCFDVMTKGAIPRHAESNTNTEWTEHIDYANDNVKIGLLFASKAVVQLVTNTIIGPLTNKVGYSVPMFIGSIILMISTLTFAFGESYAVLFAARAIQGVGSSCTSVSGMGMLADRYLDENERGSAMGIALGGVALGVLVGPTFGGVMYELAGKRAPFLILCGMGLLDGVIIILALKPSVRRESHEGSSIANLLKDPYILIAAGALMWVNMAIALMEPSLPIWMIDKMGTPSWQLGMAFLPASISYLLSTNLIGRFGHKLGRWMCSLIGMVLVGIGLFSVPFAKNIFHLIPPVTGIGFAIGMVDSSIIPLLGQLVDLRHVAVYGSVYALEDLFMSLGYAIGPALSGTIVKAMGFHWLMWTFAVVNVAYAPILIFLRRPVAREKHVYLTANDFEMEQNNPEAEKLIEE